MNTPPNSLAAFGQYLEYEQSPHAQHGIYFAPAIHGLLQTAEYAALVCHSTQQGQPPTAERMRRRLARQHHIFKHQPPLQVTFLLTESLLLDLPQSPVGTGQLKHLLELNQRPNVTMRVLPTGIFHIAQWMPDTTVLELADGRIVAYQEHIPGPDVFCDDPAEVAGYVQIMNQLLTDHALGENDSRLRLQSVLSARETA